MVPLDDFITSQWFQNKADPGRGLIYSRYWRHELLGILDAATQPVVVISNYYDAPLSRGNASDIIAHRNLKHWFAVNCDLIHEKVTPIPMAIHASKLKAMRAATTSTRNNLLYVNFRLHSDDRRAALAYFSQCDFATVVPHNKRAVKQYYRDVANSRFVVSPNGGGVDCYRTWEALALGAIPIVRRSYLSRLFRFLPVVEVSDWTEVTPESLRVPDKAINLESLTKAYWDHRVELELAV